MTMPSKGLSRVSARFGATLTGRLILLCVTLVLATALAVWIPVQHSLRSELVSSALQQLVTGTEKQTVIFLAYIGASEADLRTLRGAPALRILVASRAAGGIDPQSGLTAAQAHGLFEGLLLDFLATHPHALQGRLIGAADAGREVVRVDRQQAGAPPRSVAAVDLQQKGDREYFKATAALPPDAVHVAPIELNVENGRLQVPHVPVYRIAMPVHRGDGTLFGILVINYDLRPLFARLADQVDVGAVTYVVNPAGDYLVHPDPARTFGFDLGARHRIQDEYPAIAATFGTGASSGFAPDVAGNTVAFAAVAIDGASAPVARLVRLIPRRTVLASIATAQNFGIAIALVTVLCAATAGALVARNLTLPLRRATAVVATGRGVLPAGGPQEVRILVDSLRHFLATERLYRATFESARQAIVTTAPDGTVTSWNPAAERLYGYSAASVVGRSVELVVPADQVAANRAVLRRILAGGPGVAMDAERLTRDGRRIVVSLTLSPVVDGTGTVVGISGIAQDVTEQRLMGETFRLTVDASPAGMIVVDDDGEVALANKAAESMFGYAADALLGVSVDMLVPAGHRHRHADYRAGFQADPATRSMGGGRDLLGRRKDGTEFPIEVGLNPFQTPEGSRVLAVIVDVTERKQSEAALRERTAELERSNEELAQFAYVASHDLQEPLRMVSGFCDLLKRKYADRLDDEGLEYIEFAVDGALRMQQLIAGLLDYSRLSTRAPDRTTVSVTDVLAKVRRDLAVIIRENAATIVGDALPAVHGDGTRIQQLFQNLIANSIRFRRDAAPVVRITAVPDGKFWRFSVRDNGIGVDYAQRERMFGIFQRLHTRDKYPGTGIGLAICKRIVERDGGAIWLESGDGPGDETGDGPGTTISFTLPMA